MSASIDGRPPAATAAPRPASRLSGVTASPIRAMYEGAPPDCLSLGLGEPGWELPEAAREALRLASELKACVYGPNRGLPGLEKALGEFYGRSPDELMITAGSQAALFALFQAYAEPGSEVLVPDAGFLAYPRLAAMAGARPVAYGLGGGGAFSAAAFRAALDASPAAAVAVINHPANPTGGGAEAAALRAAAEACASRGVLLISDESYAELHLGERQPRLAELTDYGVTVASLSKAWAAPGLRIGWALGRPEVLAPARLVHNYMNTAPARPSQVAAEALIRASAQVLPASRAALALRWERFRSAAERYLGLSPKAPAGGFYAWLRLPSGAESDPPAFCLRVRDEGRVIVVPGLAFGEAGRAYARLSFAGAPDEIEEAMRRLGPFWRKS